jgi:hypothetical protein
MDKAIDDIALSQTINLANQTTLLLSYLDNSRLEAVDLSKAEEELKKFKKVEMLSNYTLFDFNLDVPLGTSNAVTGAYVGLGFLLFISSILCCCTCKCFRVAVFGILKLCWSVLCKLVCCLVCLARRAVNDNEVSDTTQMDELSPESSSSDSRIARRQASRKGRRHRVEPVGESLTYI